MTEVNTNAKKFVHLKWSDENPASSGSHAPFDWMIHDLCKDIMHDVDNKRMDKPTGVYGIPRGGLVMATVISNELNIPMLAAPCKGCIVVDDIADSGITLQHYKECGYYIATWGYKPTRSLVRPDWFYENFEEDEWVYFPWEYV